MTDAQHQLRIEVGVRAGLGDQPYRTVGSEGRVEMIVGSLVADLHIGFPAPVIFSMTVPMFATLHRFVLLIGPDHQHGVLYGRDLTDISCLGLLGLVIYTTNHRVKEIGIRKVLGASAARIVGILSKDFIKLVGIAFVIATPI